MYARRADPLEYEELHAAALATTSGIRCDPSQPHHPTLDELRAHPEVEVVYDGAGPALYALHNQGRIRWLVLIRPSRDAACLLAKHLFDRCGKCEGAVENAAVRGLFDHPNIQSGHTPNPAYLEWVQ